MGSTLVEMAYATEPVERTQIVRVELEMFEKLIAEVLHLRVKVDELQEAGTKLQLERQRLAGENRVMRGELEAMRAKLANNGPVF